MDHSKSVNYVFSHILIIFAFLAILIVSNLYILIPLLGEISETFLISTTEASLSISVFSFFMQLALSFLDHYQNALD
ncbi:hypothetical protein H1D32_01480 [Anaerobacillus sp. CMMVII]|uniref:hypothetical protein n=1 Tax=Anaerobacillus sp. CMMVII TaxID=2755588 RepID=UPI0021B791FE|nr:hypothetical protein [Anaerobacillus sp. CMMVII]MCT8136551.1 hypothetical protein [Anaerobacillus sp. CMMVII]